MEVCAISNDQPITTQSILLSNYEIRMFDKLI